MRKQFLIVETTQLDQNAPADMEVEEAPRALAPEERVRINARGDVERIPARPRRGGRRPPRDMGLEADMPDRFRRYFETDIVIAYSLPEAEEYVSEAIQRNPQLKFVVYESVSFFETVATPAVKKMWDANGQLRESA